MNLISRNVFFRNEPHTDFSDPAVRAMMDTAIDAYLADLSEHRMIPEIVSVIIDGRRYVTKRLVEIHDPGCKSRVLGQVAFVESEEAVNLACNAAARAFYTMQNGDPLRELEKRKQVVRAMLRIIRREKYNIAASIVFESAKSQHSALAEIEEAIDFALLYLQYADEVFSSDIYQPDLDSEENTVVWEPRGPTAAISVWNFAFSLLIEKLIASYLAACPVILKPAEQSPLTGWWVIKIFLEAIECVWKQGIEVDPGVIAYLPGEGDIGDMLVRHPLIANICFTGSQKVGLSIDAVAKEVVAKRPHDFPFGIKHVDLELGGINPMIITQFADEDESLYGVIQSKFQQKGEKCSALQHCYCVGSQKHPYWHRWLLRLKNAVSSLEWGHPADKERRYHFGPLIGEDAFKRVRHIIEEAKKVKEPFLEIDLSHLEKDGWYVGPVIFLEHEFSEEIFGPVLTISFVPSLEEAVKRAGKYPHITAGIYSQSKSECEFFVREMRKRGSGNIYVNRPIIGSMPGRNPYGGRRIAGTGKVGIKERLRFFLDPVTITRDYFSHGVLMKIE